MGAEESTFAERRGGGGPGGLATNSGDQRASCSCSETTVKHLEIASDALGAAFANQVLTLQTPVQVLDGSLKGPGAASSGEQTLCFGERSSSLSDSGQSQD